MTRSRRDDRSVDFTEEFLASIPRAIGHTDIWYDKQQPYLFARRGPTNDTIHLGVVSGKKAIRGAFLQGDKISKLTRMPGVSLAEARVIGAELHEKFKDYAKMGKLTRGKHQNKHAIPGQGASFDADKMLNTTVVENPNYDSVMSILMDAYQQLTTQKGAARHASGLTFEDQDMIQIMEGVGINFALGQAMKKILEGRRLHVSKAREEFLGAIIYMAGAVVWLDKQDK